jgi:hypothetical protein
MLLYFTDKENKVMQKFELNINCRDDAFQPDARPEVARILRDIADQLDRGETAAFYRTILDINVNDVGRFKLHGVATGML